MLAARAVLSKSLTSGPLEVDHIVPSDDERPPTNLSTTLQASDTLRRSDQNGKVAATSEETISRVSGSMGEGSKNPCGDRSLPGFRGPA